MLVQLQSVGWLFAAGGCGVLDTGGMFGYVFHHIYVDSLLCKHLPMVLIEWVPSLVQILVLVMSPSEMGDLVVE